MSNLTLILVICAVVTVLVTLGGVAVKWILKEISDEASNRSDSAAEIKKQQTDIRDSIKSIVDAHEKRLDRVETKHADFMPKAEILQLIDHEKASRATLNQAMLEFHKQNSGDITAVRIEVGKLQSEHSNLSNIVGEIKSLLKDQRQEQNDRFDRLQNLLNEVARSVKP